MILLQFPKNEIQKQKKYQALTIKITISKIAINTITLIIKNNNKFNIKQTIYSMICICSNEKLNIPYYNKVM